MQIHTSALVRGWCFTAAQGLANLALWVWLRPSAVVGDFGQVISASAAWVVCLTSTWLLVLSALALTWPSRSPQWWRRVVLGVCGAAVSSSLVLPAHAADVHPRPSDLTGLPLPDRFPGGQALEHVSAPKPHRYAVKAGDSLWRIADRTGRGHQTPRRTQLIYRLNRDLIGANPDLIHPGMRLTLPPKESR